MSIADTLTESTLRTRTNEKNIQKEASKYCESWPFTIFSSEKLERNIVPRMIGQCGARAELRSHRNVDIAINGNAKTNLPACHTRGVSEYVGLVPALLICSG